MNTPFPSKDAGELLLSLKNEASPVSSTSFERAILSDFVHSAYSQAFAGFCALLACCITLHHVYCHLKNYTCYPEQRCIIRIVFIIPAYAVYSFTSLMLTVHAPLGSVYVEPLRDIAEAVAIYSFLALCYQYLGGEGSIMLELMGRTIP
ncbi:unnamed protein product [Dicrocoelium dendriticum]|nr:unnamed protein product [Dicrocoelium dendriticum]